MALTVSFNEPTGGWSSFYSYSPEFMIGMNNSFYSFNGGNLYLHNSGNVPVCNFYGVQSSAFVSTMVNERPLERKLMKAVALESDAPWQASFSTDESQQTALVTTSQYVLKEGMYFSNIKHDSALVSTPNFKNRSTVGVGLIASGVTGAGTTRTFTFATNIEFSSSISVGDRIWYGTVAGSPPTVATLSIGGTISAISGNTITATGLAAPAIGATGLLIVAVKNAQAESYGISGGYAQMTLTHTDAVQSELFSVEIDYMKSFP
jgi:hypothetical protein